MTDEELRSLVRAAVARHLSQPGPATGAGGMISAYPRAEGPGFDPRANPSALPAFHRYALSRSDNDDACLIEPRVRCTHCGFCQSHGF